MKIKLLALLAILSMPFQLVNADVEADFNAGMTIYKIINNAITEGNSIDEVVAEMVALHPEMATIIVKAAINQSEKDVANIVSAATEANPGAALDIVTVALDAVPSQAAAIVVAATSAAPSQTDAVINAAISSGADPTTITQAAAAGKTTSFVPTLVIRSDVPATGSGILASPN